MGKVTGFLKSKIPSSKESEYTPGEFSEHEYPDIDLEKAEERSKHAEKVSPKYKAMLTRMRAEAKKFGRTITMFMW